MEDTLAYLLRAPRQSGRKVENDGFNESTEFVDPNVLAFGDPRYWLVSRLNYHQVAPFPFLINWDDFTEAEILKEIGKWIQQEKSRRVYLSESSKTTNESKLRHSLRDIAAARILRTTSQKALLSTEFYAEFKQPLSARTSPSGWKEELHRLRRDAQIWFSRCFSLREGQMMASYVKPRRGGRRKQ